MNQLVGKDANGRDFVFVVLEPGNIHGLQNHEPIEVRIEDFFPDGIPKKLNLGIFYSETPVKDSKEFREMARVTLDERTPYEAKRPHCPQCRSSIEQLGVWRNQSPMAIVFCTQCGCSLGLAPSEVVRGLKE